MQGKENKKLSMIQLQPFTARHPPPRSVVFLHPSSSSCTRKYSRANTGEAFSNAAAARL